MRGTERSETMKRMLMCVVLSAVLLAGCCLFDGATKDLIGDTAVLAAQVAKNAESQDVPQGLKDYLAENAKQWAYFDDLAHGRKGGEGE